jgi:hypothetical protein
MKLAVMQPYFFPYLGQFDLINRADMWIAYDVAQYIRHGWVNRNRVLHPASGWQYIIVPLKKHSHTVRINELEISTGVAWRTRIFRQLQHYRTDAPYYSDVIGFLEECLATAEPNLARLNIETFRRVCERLGIKTPIHVFSEMDLAVEPGHGPQALALGISKAVGASEYINPPGGAGLYNAAEFAAQGIQLTIQSFTPLVYGCGRYQYEPALSILDAMMWNSVEAIRHYLDVSGQHDQSCAAAQSNCR